MKSTTFTAVALLLGIGCAYSQENFTVDNVLQQVGDVVGNPELNIKQFNINESTLPNVEEAKNLFKEKCIKNGGPDAFENANRAQIEMGECLQSYINITELQAEMEKYKPTGDLDIVFKNYCSKRFTLRACVSNFTQTLEQCLDEKEKANKKIVMNITDSLLEFICYKEGDRIALFISAGGPECFQSKQQAIQDCANRTFSGYIPKSDPASGAVGLEYLPSLNFDTKECRDMTKLQTCVVEELEKCSDPTPANIMDSIFNFIKKATPCEGILNAQSAAATGTQFPSSASHVSVLSTITTLFAALSFVTSYKLYLYNNINTL